MPVTIVLNGQLASGRSRQNVLDLTPGITVQQVVEQMELDLEEIGLITINGVQSELQDVLPENCRLALFPYVTGG